MNNANTTLQLDAYDICRGMVSSLVGKPGWPAVMLLSTDDIGDVINETYLAILPMLPAYDPQRGKLSTYLYYPVRRRALAIAWTLARRGLTGAGDVMIDITPWPEDTDKDIEIDEFVDDGADLAEVADSGEASALAYNDPPEGLEPPGSDEALSRESAEDWYERCRKVLKAVLPAKHLQALEERYGERSAENKVSGKKFPRFTDAWFIRQRINSLFYIPKIGV